MAAIRARGGRGSIAPSPPVATGLGACFIEASRFAAAARRRGVNAA